MDPLHGHLVAPHLAVGFALLAQHARYVPPALALYGRTGSLNSEGETDMLGIRYRWPRPSTGVGFDPWPQEHNWVPSKLNILNSEFVVDMSVHGILYPPILSPLTATAANLVGWQPGQMAHQYPLPLTSALQTPGGAADDRVGPTFTWTPRRVAQFGISYSHTVTATDDNPAHHLR